MDEFLKYKIKDSSETDSPDSPSPKLNKKRLFKFILIFVGIMVLVGGGYLVWDNCLSPSAQYSRQANANYQKYLDQQNKYKAAMTADTYGGKTPEETLSLFITALKSGDMTIASKYFVLGDDGQPDPEWLDGLNAAKKDGQIESIIELLSNNARPAGSWTSDKYGFEIRNTEGKLLYDINLILNKYSNVWKIENM
jgi:hypothetical protein